jgi:hypothetical protein
MQWVRAAVTAGLTMSIFDNKEVHRTVFMTTECVENYIRTMSSCSCVTVTVYGGPKVRSVQDV